MKKLFILFRIISIIIDAFGLSSQEIERQYQKYKISVVCDVAMMGQVLKIGGGSLYTTKGIRNRIPFVAKPSS